MHIKHVVYGFSLALIVSYNAVAFAYDPYDCLNDAVKADSTIPVGLATRLCAAAWSPEPAKCYQNASLTDSTIPRFIAVDLCAGSVSSDRTLECYAKSSDRKLNRGLATSLCGATKLN